MSVPPPVSVRAATEADATAIARLHEAAFPDYFLTHLGPRFLRRYYAAFLHAPHTVVLGFVDGELAGMVAGTTDLAGFRRDLYRPNLIAFPLIAAGRFVRDPVVRREVRRRLHHVGLAMRSLLGRSDDAADGTASEDGVTSSLFSICVAPQAQGSGVADAVMAAYLDAERGRGATRVVLSVDDDNARAIRFYERGGWTEAERDAGSILYERRLAP